MKRIMLIGSGGAGKSTLAKQLSEKLQINVIHLDTLLSKPNWVGVSREEQIKIQEELVKEDEWIIDGNYGGTMDIRLDAADTILYFDIPRTTCVDRVFKRMIKYRNRSRPDMLKGCVERIDFQFLKWVWNYPKDKRPAILKKIKALSNEKQVVILHSPKEVSEFLQSA